MIARRAGARSIATRRVGLVVLTVTAPSRPRVAACRHLGSGRPASNPWADCQLDRRSLTGRSTLERVACAIHLRPLYFVGQTTIQDAAPSDYSGTQSAPVARGLLAEGASLIRIPWGHSHSSRNPSSRQRVRAGRRHEPLRHPVVDVMEPVVERAGIELDGSPQ